MEHTEYYLVVDGVYEAEIIVDGDGRVISNGDAGLSPNTLDEWLSDLAVEAADSEATFRVYRIDHGDHDLFYDGCECVQFEQSHLPVWESA